MTQYLICNNETMYYRGHLIKKANCWSVGVLVTWLEHYLAARSTWNQRHWWCNRPLAWQPGLHLPANHLPRSAPCDTTVTRQPGHSSWRPHEERGRAGTHTALPLPAPSDRSKNRTHTFSNLRVSICLWICPSLSGFLDCYTLHDHVGSSVFLFSFHMCVGFIVSLSSPVPCLLAFISHLIFCVCWVLKLTPYG